ncbi:uncharacterized protein [Euwallacea similis]|uniref:uncharacterized protein n=1 Tax=Euwallacea similis TaxID=1736056 RepID=UPI00345084CF
MAEDVTGKEASEVLHSLLSEKQDGEMDENQSHNTNFNQEADVSVGTEEQAAIHYTPVSISHSYFSTIDGTSTFPTIDDPQVVIWEGHAIVDPLDSNLTAIYASQPISEETTSQSASKSIEPKHKPTQKSKSNRPKSVNRKKVSPREQKKKAIGLPAASEPTKLEENPVQVKERFKRGCECHDESCFRGLNPETVFKHRHNIAELTKGEHDMYLMGVTMACLANPDITVRHRERRRLRAQYVYQGRRVCLDAFLYLENCTHYQLKRIRKHVMTHGVAPRVHGNHGKKPHNTFSLDIYCHAREFLKQYLEQHTGERDILNTKLPIQLPWDVTRKNLHDAYKEYGQILEPGVKLMGYSTFRHFMKEQFPHVKFCKLEPRGNNHQPPAQQPQQQHPQQILTQNQPHVQVQLPAQIRNVERQKDQNIQQVQKCIISSEVQQVIPLVVSSTETSVNQQSQTFLVTPVPQILSSANVVTSQNTPNTNASTFAYQLTNAGYVINEQGNIVTTIANDHHTSYFSRI